MRHSTGNRRSACKGKIRFDTYHEANIARDQVIAKFGDYMAVYACGHCGGFHQGHVPTRDQRRRGRMNRLIQLIDKANGR